MPARLSALTVAALALSLLAGGCGGDDAATPLATTPAAAPAPSTSATTTPGAAASTPAGSSPADATGTTGLKRPAGMPPQKADDANVMERIIQNPQLTTFTTLLKQTGLSNKLARRGPYTVLAPSNDAFAKLGNQLKTLTDPANNADLRQLLSFQIVLGRYLTTELKDGQLLTTLQGGRLRVTTKGTAISVKNSKGSATIVVPDAQATNGVVQVTDELLVPNL